MRDSCGNVVRSMRGSISRVMCEKVIICVLKVIVRSSRFSS